MSGAAPPLRVLNVDDYAPARYARTKVLRQAGFEVVEASTGAEALACVEALKPEVILLDINLPDISGYDVCRRLKDTPATATIPILHLSASHRGAGDHARGLDAGADGFLVEPVASEVLLATVRSVARARQAEEAVRAAARQWQLTFDAITDGVCLLDRDGAVQRHNTVFAALAGGEGVAGQDGLALLGRVLGRPAADLRDLLVLDRRVALEFSAGSRWLRLGAEAVRDEAGRPEGTLVIITDVTEHKRMEDLRGELLRMEQRARLGAEASNRAKDEFLAVLSHELRTPLTAMLGWIRMLAVGRLDAAATAHAIEVIERNTRLQAQIVEDLLDVSRIISGKMTLQLRDLSPAAVLETAAEGIRAAAAAKQIQLEVRVSADLGCVRGDSGRLQQVFSNLLSNAVKFTPAGGRVGVIAGAHDAGVRIAVTDSGRGIDPSLLPYVFEPFRQAEGARRRTHTGLGLGLAIVRHLVELHGGRVDAASAGLGQGATFSVWLPAEPPEAAEVPAAGEAAGDVVDRPSLHGIRLLLVEDDADTREVVGLMLRESGAVVIGVDSADAALAVINIEPPDVLIGDIGLGDRDGYDLIRAVRRLPGEPGDVPAIALSAFARESDRLEALRAGYDRHLSKPIEPATLRSAVAQLLSARPGR
ncbi:MAG TPA: response regulator [Methylomirabilota bacterium]